MNPKILQKCIDELKKDSPTIQYVLGMLETLVEMQVDGNSSYKHAITKDVIVPGQVVFSEPQHEVSEGEMLEKLAAARIKEVEGMSTIDVITQTN